jgi:serine/threonine protein kinase
MTTSSPQPGTDPPARVEMFLRAVLRSKLLDEPQLAAALKDVVPAIRADADALADHLVRTGKLSRYQSSKLLAGHWRGLFVGPYQVLGPIGKGGTGKVYLARDQRAGGLVALKVLPPHRIRTRERLLARFRREMEICQRVAHPDLARTFETGADRGVYYIAMEYFPGRSLARIVATEGPLAPERAARLLAQVAEAIDHAHHQDIIHRDLKPGNVQVTPDDRAKVLDLGLALVRGEEQKDSLILGGRNRIVGTMDYIAPEQTADATRADARSDVYSLGCTLYFVLSGRPPFPGGTSRDKIQRQRNEEPLPLQSLRPELPPALTALVAQMMAKDPTRRPQTAAEVAAALRCVAGLPPEKVDNRRTVVVGPTAVSPWWLMLMLALCALTGGAAWFCLSR